MTNTRTTTEYAVLGSLFSGSRHGYEILQFLDQGMGSAWRVSTSQLYTLLKKMESRGLLWSNVESQRNRPSKRVFAMTAEGKRVFLEWLNRPTQHVRTIRNEFLAKLFFFYHHSTEGAGRLVEAQLVMLRRRKKDILREAAAEKDPYQKLVLGFKRTTLDNSIQWLNGQARAFVENNIQA